MNPEIRVARKQHLCNFCELPIEPNTKYSYERLTPWDHPDNEGYVTWRAHIACRKFWESGYGQRNGDFPHDSADFCEAMAAVVLAVTIAVVD